MSVIYSQDTTALQIASDFTLNLVVPQVSTPAIGNKKPLAVINNETGCTLAVSLSGGRNFTIPAGAWTKPFAIYPQDVRLVAVVQNVLPNSPVNIFSITVYRPDEEVVEPVALGNSPIGISGSVATTSGNSLKNDGNNPPVSIIESTPADQTASSFSLNNDASGFIQVLSANVLRKILNVVRGNSGSGKAAITLGDSGDTAITTLYGTVGAGSVVPGNTVNGAVANATTASALSGNINANQVNAGQFATGKYSFKSPANGSGNPDTLSILNGAGSQGLNIGVSESGDSVNNPAGYIFDTTTGLFLAVGGRLVPSSMASGNLPGGVFQQNGKTIAGLDSAGPGAAGTRVWDGTNDPGPFTVEGDIWAPA